MGIVILAAGVWMVRLLATPGPPEPDEAGLVEINVDYRCIVCGLQLTVTHVQGDEGTPPKHCREEMVFT